VWVIEKDSLSAWYLPVDAVGGAAAELDMSGLFKRGGYLVAGGTWTIDGGEGLDDYWVAMTSEGEVAVYRGTDPSSGSTWSLVGVWYIGSPIGDRPFKQWASELLVITEGGVYPMARALQSSQVSHETAITYKIQEAISSATNTYRSNYGWEIEIFPDADMLILNVPVSDGSNQEQYVMNTITGSWGRFTGISANCWALFNGVPYFGSNTYVGKFWQDLDDNGADIEADIKQAFNYFGDRGSIKQWKMARPILAANGIPAVLASLNVDYEDEEPFSDVSFSPIPGAVWDTAVWDTGQWNTDFYSLKSWQTVNGVGTAAALRLKIKAQGISTRFQATDYVFEPGEVI
jgi:hypothetical protein